MIFFYFVSDSNLTNYADDNTPYAPTLIEWFNNNYFKMNADKCHLLITNHEEDVSVVIDGEIIKGEKSVKLFGDKHRPISWILIIMYQTYARRSVLKLHALTRISRFMSTDKLRIVMKAFVESQFGYCPP